MVHLSSGSCITLSNLAPVNEVVDVGVDVPGADILEVKIVSMLPHIHGQDGCLACKATPNLALPWPCYSLPSSNHTKLGHETRALKDAGLHREQRVAHCDAQPARIAQEGE